MTTFRKIPACQAAFALVLAACGSMAATNFAGVNWADVNDNWGDILYVDGLSANDTYSSAAVVADRVIGQFQTKLKANTVRMPVSPNTVSRYWGTYTGAIDKALEKGMKVILCSWDGSREPTTFPFRSTDRL
jgi:hypothetical protein